MAVFSVVFWSCVGRASLVRRSCVGHVLAVRRSCVGRALVMRWSCKKSGGQSSFLNTAFGDCLGLWKAVAFDENRYNQLKAKMKAGSHQSSMRRFVTARVVKRAVDINEMTF